MHCLQYFLAILRNLVYWLCAQSRQLDQLSPYQAYHFLLTLRSKITVKLQLNNCYFQEKPFGTHDGTRLGSKRLRWGKVRTGFS